MSKIFFFHSTASPEIINQFKKPEENSEQKKKKIWIESKEEGKNSTQWTMKKQKEILKPLNLIQKKWNARK